MFYRPKPSETDDDLLRLHDEFQVKRQKNEIQLAATVISNEEGAHSHNERNQFKSVTQQIENTFESIPDSSGIGKIIERKEPSSVSNTIRFNFPSGFPKANRRNFERNYDKKQSIFGQQIRKQLSVEPMNVNSGTSHDMNKIHISLKPEKLTDESKIVKGRDKMEIHNENVVKLNAMTDQEIRMEREQLLEKMDPALVQYVRSLAKRKIPNSNESQIQHPTKLPLTKIEEIDSANDVLLQAENWLNFNIVETTKLAWMRNVSAPKISKNQAYEARFDFSGWLLPYTSNITESNRALYHHGEEPGRPGYTLQELFQLSRSEVLQQKIIAHNCIANILSLYSTGVYYEILDLPIEQIFFVVRFGLDDNIPSVVNCSVKAMKNLIFHEIDEVCLDAVLGFGSGYVQPLLFIDNNEDDNTMNDQQVVETNVVKCLVRSGILFRIRYIIETIQPNLDTVTNCLCILIRLARDSDKIVEQILKCDRLLQIIITKYCSNNFQTENVIPLQQAIKFIRVLASRGKFIAEYLLEHFNIVDCLIAYIISREYTKNAIGMKLQTEALHLWCILLKYDQTVDKFKAITPILLEHMNYHLHNTNLEPATTFIRNSLVAAILNVLSVIAVNSPMAILPFLHVIEECSQKWMQQFVQANSFEVGKLQILAALFACLSSLYEQKLLSEEFIKATQFSVMKIIESNCFDNLTASLKNGSMLLNDYSTLSSVSNLKTLEASAWYTSEHVIPIFQKTSPILFLNSLSHFIETTEEMNLHLGFLHQTNIALYIEEVIKSDQYYLTGNWFTRFEASFIMNILKMSVYCKSNVDTTKYYTMAVKTLNIYSYDMKPDINFILSNIIFCEYFYPTEFLMNNLAVTSGNESLDETLSEILKIYIDIMGLNKGNIDFSTTQSMNVTNVAIIPIDWIYMPIIQSYANQQQKQKTTISERYEHNVIGSCLKLILIYDTHFTHLLNTIGATDRYCRLVCVFLCSDNLFLDNDIQILLLKCIRNILEAPNSMLYFEKEIKGLTTFQDLYVQLLEQYQGVSYGNILFGNYILIPLRQKHNVKYRKTLWSEYLGVVQCFNVTEEQAICPIIEFLDPPENDVSLIKCYRKALANNSVRRHSILFTIAKHHVLEWDKSMRNKVKV